MKIKFLTKDFTIKIEELGSGDIGGLKEKIRETIAECSSKQDSKILLFHNKIKLPEDPSLPLSDEKVKITDESTIFVVMVPGQPLKQEEKKPEQQGKPISNASPPQAQAPPYSGFPPMYPFPQMRSPAMDGMQDPSMAVAMKAFEQMMDNPESIMQAMEAHMPNMTAEQRAQIRQQVEVMKNNPDLVNQILNNPAVANMARSNPYMMGMGASPMMGSPMPYNNPYMGAYQPQPWMPPASPGMYGADQIPPPNGPCTHGFYPPQYVDGKAVPQDARRIWANQLSDLNEMGFNDEEDNVNALRRSKGDISKAIEYLTEAKDKS